MKALSFLLAVVGSLVLAPAAAAKEGPPYRVCGESGCAAVAPGADSVLVLDQSAEQPAPSTLAYYRIEFSEMRAGRYVFLPARGLVGAPVAADGTLVWYSLRGSSALERLRAAAATVRPYSAPPSWTPSTAAAPAARDWTPWLLAAAALLVAGAAAATARSRTIRRLVLHSLVERPPKARV